MKEDMTWSELITHLQKKMADCDSDTLVSIADLLDVKVEYVGDSMFEVEDK